MTKKDYIKLAESIEVVVDTVDGGEAVLALIKVANNIADVLALDNPNFNRQKFLAACGVE